MVRPCSSRLPILMALVLCVFATQGTALFCGDDNCFDILGITRNATKAQVRRAYRKLSSAKHPDKRPGDKGALDEFRRIGNAYETLTDDAKRAKYEDFLDNPGKYWQYLMANAKDVYRPKSNVFLVITGIIGIITLIHWLNMNNSYKQTLARMKDSLEFKRQVSRLVKSKQAATKEEAEAMINLDVVGLEEPHWKNLIIFKIIALPPTFFKYLLWNLNWFVSYKIRKLQYSPADQQYLIMKNMHLNEQQWGSIPDKEKKAYMDEQLWETEKCEDYLRFKKIELNRLGKGKKKKKASSLPYSEVEDINMSE